MRRLTLDNITVEDEPGKTSLGHDLEAIDASFWRDAPDWVGDVRRLIPAGDFCLLRHPGLHSADGAPVWVRVDGMMVDRRVKPRTWPATSFTRGDKVEYTCVGRNLEGEPVYTVNYLSDVEALRPRILDWLDASRKQVTCNREIFDEVLGGPAQTSTSRRIYSPRSIGAVMRSLPGWRAHRSPLAFPKYGRQRAWVREGFEVPGRGKRSSVSTEKTENPVFDIL